MQISDSGSGDVFGDFEPFCAGHSVMTSPMDLGNARLFVAIATFSTLALLPLTRVHCAPPWYINNVLSTATDVPGVAKRVPLRETTVVRGTILGPDGSPAENAEVWAASLFAEPPRRERVLTDQAGRFQLNLAPLTGKSERWAISAYLDDASVRISDPMDWIKQPSSKQPKPIFARLVPRGRVTCRVLTAEDRQPISGARMFLGDGRVLASDEEGLIKIGGLKSGGHRSVIIAAGRHRRRVLFDTTMRPDRQLNILLPQAGRIEGEVHDGQGNSIRDAWIKVQGSGSALAMDGRCAVADEEGRFVWDGLLGDQVLYGITAGAEGFEPVRKSNISISLVKPTRIIFRLVKRTERKEGSATPNDAESKISTLDKDVTTFAKRNIVGVVVDPNGDPVPNAMVRWGATEYEEVKRASRTTGEGRFELPLVPNRDGYVTVMADEMAPMFHRIEVDRNVALIQLQHGATIGGRVVNSAGEAIASVHVYPVINSPDPDLLNPYCISQRATTTDDLGRFSITGLPSHGTRFDFVSAEHSDLRGQALKVGVDDHVVKLTSRGGFRGRVVDAAGNPIPEFLVKIDFPQQQQPNDHTAGFAAIYKGIGVTYTDAQGRFAWGEGIKPGAVYRVTVQADGYRDSTIDRVKGVLVDRLPQSDEHVFQLSPMRQISVQVLEASQGQPIQGATVSLLRDDVRAGSLIRWGYDDTATTMIATDENGFVHQAMTSSSGSILAVAAPGYAHTTVAWDGDSKDLTVELDREVPILGAIRSTDGVAVAGLSVSLREPDGSTQGVRLDHDSGGRFEFRGAPAGVTEIIVRDNWRVVFRQSFETEVGRRAKVQLTLNTVSGEVVESDIEVAQSD